MGGTAGLKCTFESGMLPSEYAVETTTAEGQKISLFTSERYLSKDRGLLLVYVIDRVQNTILVRLPDSPLEVSSRFINVDAEDVVEFPKETPLSL